METDPKTVREIARKHIRSGRADIGTTIVKYFGNAVLGDDEFADWEHEVTKAWYGELRAVSWPDEQQPAAATGGEQTQPWPRTQRMPLAVAGGRPQPWHHQAIVEYGAATGTELEPNPTVPGGYTATQINWAITWWNERVEAERVQDGAAGRVEAWVNRIAAHASDETDTRRIADFRAVLAERNILAARVAELEGERSKWRDPICGTYYPKAEAVTTHEARANAEYWNAETEEF